MESQKCAQKSKVFTKEFKEYEMKSLAFAEFLLFVSAFLITTLIIYLWRRRSRQQFVIIFLSGFLIAFPVSGLTHLMRPSRDGYFSLHQNGLQYLSIQGALMVLGLSVCITLFYASQKSFVITEKVQGYSTKRISTFMLVASLPLLVLGVLASQKLSSAIELQNFRRVIALSGGNARYAYLATWGVWGVIFLGSAILEKLRLPKFSKFVVAGVTIFTIFQLLNWTGARLAPLIYAATFIIGNIRHLESARRLLIPIGVIGYFIFAVVTTNRRKMGYSGEQGFNILDILDWEAGRFSILGGSIWTANHNGYLRGESFVFTWNLLTEGIQKILDLPAQLEIGNTQSISQALGNGLLGSDKVNYIAPGILVEMFLNFGFLGMLFSVSFCIILLNRIQYHYQNSPNNVSKMLYFYFGTSLISCLILSSSMSLLGAFVFNPVPIYLAFLYSRKERSLLGNVT
jgi:hypothetical protein